MASEWLSPSFYLTDISTSSSTASSILSSVNVPNNGISTWISNYSASSGDNSEFFDCTVIITNCWLVSTFLIRIPWRGIASTGQSVPPVCDVSAHGVVRGTSAAPLLALPGSAPRSHGRSDSGLLLWLLQSTEYTIWAAHNVHNDRIIYQLFVFNTRSTSAKIALAASRQFSVFEDIIASSVPLSKTALKDWPVYSNFLSSPRLNENSGHRFRLR
ncbi:hypothetical protein T08_8114 [Trichinella sp. T8]|nr:hypothetical protein T08_8114 [Trichinella sp. T8]